MKRLRLNRGCPVARRSRAASRLAIPDGGFSLVELLVVAALLIILSSLYWGSTSETRDRRVRKRCEENLQKVYMALQIYANDYASRFPVVPGARTSEEGLNVLIPRYTVDTPVFVCPASKDGALAAGEPFLRGKISYAYYMGRRSTEANEPLMSDRQVNSESKGAGEAAFSLTGKAPGNNHGKAGGNFLFGDGHTQWSPAHLGFPILLGPGGVKLLNPKP